MLHRSSSRTTLTAERRHSGAAGLEGKVEKRQWQRTDLLEPRVAESSELE
ncbi:uncharacterized protein DS421_10g306500 [Arachis hypogaea]|nr:uncharacterized protein DS421_10g306500 [Arachis hypogaea]